MLKKSILHFWGMCIEHILVQHRSNILYIFMKKAKSHVDSNIKQWGIFLVVPNV